MKIIIVGCGKIGTTIIANLVSEGHDVVGIDSDPAVISNLTDLYDVMCVCGNGVDCDVLAEADVDKCELFVSVTGSDEFNMLSCYLAGKMGAKNTIARIRNPEYNDKSLGFMRNELELSDSINPEQLCAREIYNILKFPGAVGIETFSARKFELLEIRLKPDSPFDGTSLAELRRKFQAKFLVCAVERDGVAIIPDGSFVLRGGDRIGITATPSELSKLLRETGLLQKKTRSVMILGASTTAFYLAKRLIDAGISVKVIEISRERCEEFSRKLPSVTVICGDGASAELLMEEGIDSADAFVSMTGLAEQNILISCLAASRNVPSVITKINRSELISMAEKMGLESIISTKKIVGDLITGYARALQNSIGSSVETLYKLMDGSVEALEFSVQSDFEYTNIPLKDMKLRKNILIAGIIRGNTPIIPAGSDIILPGDKVVVFASGTRLSVLSDIMA
ncbi:MAG: Trk system potassium transporter TrkA [Clostridia bacterium]|nr:Trk system potassium transporter TrkA [Clostridia bacterium]